MKCIAEVQAALTRLEVHDGRACATRWDGHVRHAGMVGMLAIVLFGAVACSPSDPTPTPAAASLAVAPSPSGGVAEPSESLKSPMIQTPLPSAVAATPSAEPQDPGPTLGPDPEYAPLDGMDAPAGTRSALPVAVMVADNPQSRPQYGFNAASIVYQAPADGGETRYMMVFQERSAARVEPVRSGRPYFVNWASEYRSAFAHYGGDSRTLHYLPELDGKYIWDVDALAGNRAAFWRDRSRRPPQNAVTATARVRRAAVREGAPAVMSAGAPVRPFRDDLAAELRPAKGSIRIPYNRGATSYTYDKATNKYLRSVKGRAQYDAADGKRVIASNVIVLYMKYSIDRLWSEKGHRRPMFEHVGSGKGLVFRDGHVIPVTWRKPTAHSLTRFYDASGKEVSLVRGRIFIQVVPTGAKVTYDAKPLE